MGSIRKHALALIAMLGASLPVAAQQPPLQLALQAERATVELGEPVYVTARLINNDARPVLVRPLLDPRDGYLKISVRTADGAGVGYMPLAVRDSDEPAATLAPRAQVARTIPIFFGATGWVFRTPGSYTVRARFEAPGADGSRVDLAAGPVTIVVRDGHAALRALVSGSEASLQAGRFLEWRGGDQLTEGRALLERTASELPESPLASHYRVASARSWVRPFKDYRVGRVRAAEPARALAELEKVRDEHLPAAVLAEKRIAQASALLASNRGKEAVEILGRIGPTLNERPELADFRDQVRLLESAARAAAARQ